MRTTQVTIDASAVQGDGATVTLRRLTWGELRAAQNKIAEIGDDKGALDEYAMQLVADLIIEWNWTDNDGAQMPLPKSAQDVMALMPEEANLLYNAIARILTGRIEKETEKN